MNPLAKWLVWAGVLLLSVPVVDFVALVIGASYGNSRSVRDAETVVVVLLGLSALLALAATGFLFWLGKGLDWRVRGIVSVVFLLLQALIFVVMALMTLLGMNR